MLTSILLGFNNHKVPYDKSQLLIHVSRLMNIQSPFSETIEIFFYKYNDGLTRLQIKFYTDFIKYLLSKVSGILNNDCNSNYFTFLKVLTQI